jgi:hypothetical protein
MLRERPEGFEDCRDIWAVDSVERLEELRERVLAEAKQGPDSVWHLEGLPPSYLRRPMGSFRKSQYFPVLPLIANCLSAKAADGDWISA